MRVKKVCLLLLSCVLLVCCLTACANRAENISIERTAAPSANDAVVYEEAAGTAALSSGNSADSDSAIPLPENRKWVITMSISMETEDLDSTLSQISKKIQSLGGYAESQSVSGTSSAGSGRYAYLTVRIPAEQADEFAADVSGMTNVTSSSRNVEDITLSYSDTEGRVTALETEQTRLLELMEQAENMSDLLEIEERLTEVRYQLENYTSALRLYDNQVNYATVNLRITQVEKYTPVQERSFWEKVTDGLSDSIADLGQIIVDFIACVIIDLPYLVVIALIAWAVIAIVRHQIRRHRAKKQVTAEKENKS